MRAIVYCRVSTDDQVESGAGLNAQRDACAGWAARAGCEVVGPFVEGEGVSGSTPMDKRPGLTEALGELAAGDVLLVSKRDRVARDRIMVAMLEALLKGRKCRLVSAAGEGTEADDPGDPMAFMYRGMSDLFAEYERILISWRTRAGLAAKRRRNERTGQVPFGMSLVDDGRRSKRRPDGGGGLPVALVPDPAEAAVVAEVKALAAAGWTGRAIADALNARGVRPKNGSIWYQSSIRLIVNRPS